MQYKRRSGMALVPVLLVAFGLTSPSVADKDSGSPAVDAHIERAERAMQEREYLTAVSEFLEAAEVSDDPDVARKATRVGFAYGFNQQALRAAKRWLRLDKDSEEARVFLGRIYFRLDELRSARRQFERLIRSGDGEPGERLLSLVDLLRDENEPGRTLKLLQSLAKPHGKSWQAHYAVAAAAMHAGEADVAIERAKLASELDPGNVRPQLLYARALMFRGDDEDAIEYLAYIIGDSPSPDPDARMELALMYMLSDRDDDALSQVNQVLLEHGNRVDALRLMAIINFRLERLDAAWDDFQDLLATGQYRMDALYYLARISDYREEYERAARLYREVRYGMNTVYSQRRASAILAHELGDVDGAMSLLDEFAEASPNHAVDMLVARAQLLVSLDLHDEGLALYDKGVEFRPDDESMVLGRAELLVRMDRIDEAVAAYRQALKRWPDSALALNALGYTLADRTDRYEEAETLIRKAIKIAPDNAAIIDSLGWILYKTGHLEQGLVELQRAYELMKDHEVAAHIVEVLSELGRRDEALDVLLDAEEKDPDSPLLDDVRQRYFPETDD